MSLINAAHSLPGITLSAGRNALDPLDVHRPARMLQQRRDAAIAIAAIVGGERDDLSGQRRLVIGPPGRLALVRAMLAQHPAGASSQPTPPRWVSRRHPTVLRDRRGAG
jgi:hypothetical protein